MESVTKVFAGKVRRSHYELQGRLLRWLEISRETEPTMERHDLMIRDQIAAEIPFRGEWLRPWWNEK